MAQYMTVQQVIDELQKVEDKTMPVCIDGDTQDWLVTSVVEMKHVVTIFTCYQDYKNYICTTSSEP